VVSDDHAPSGSPSNPIIIHADEVSTVVALDERHNASGSPNEPEIEIAKSWASDPELMPGRDLIIFHWGDLRIDGWVPEVSAPTASLC
jgi:hypothetical protein